MNTKGSLNPKMLLSGPRIAEGLGKYQESAEQITISALLSYIHNNFNDIITRSRIGLK